MNDAKIEEIAKWAANKLNGGDWYDLNADGIIASNEKLEGDNSLKRIR